MIINIGLGRFDRQAASNEQIIDERMKPVAEFVLPSYLSIIRSVYRLNGLPACPHQADWL